MLSVCCQNKFFVSYYEAGNVKVYSKDREFPSSIGTPDPGERQLKCPVGLAIDRFNNLVVCDRETARLMIFTLEGQFVNSIDTGLTGPCSVAVSNNGQLFVTDLDKSCVHVFQ